MVRTLNHHVMCLHVWCVCVQTTRTGTTGQPFGTALDYGAGHVDPVAALNPGLGIVLLSTSNVSMLPI